MQGNGIEFHKITLDYPPFSPEEMDGLINDIKTNGQYDPILRWHGYVVDGRHRQLACQSLGIDPIYEDIDDLSEAQMLTWVQSKNLHRRHLPEEVARVKRNVRIARATEKRRAGKSTRQIAEEEEVSQTQIRRDLQDSTAPGGGAVEPADGKVVGKDGKRRKAKDSTAPGGGAVEPADNGHVAVSHTSVDDRPELVDACNISVPEHLRDVFEARKDFNDFVAELKSLTRRVNALAQGPGGARLRLYLKSETTGTGDKEKTAYRSDHIGGLRVQIKDGQPHTCVCPDCSGGEPGNGDPACEHCRGEGWISQRQWNGLQGAQREALLGLGQGDHEE